MKVITENLITSVTASTEAAGFPKENLLDEYPGFVWKATGATATLTFTLNGLSSGLALFNTNADIIDVEVSDPNAVQWETNVGWEANVAWSAFISPQSKIEAQDDTTSAYFIFWDEVNMEVVVTIQLENSNAETLFAGCAVGGLVHEFSNPTYRFAESTKDLSIVSEYNTGGVYVKDRDVLRVFDIEQFIYREDEFYNFIYNVKREIKSHPAAWVITDEDNSRWFVYARFTKEPSATHVFHNLTLLTYQLTEVR